MIALIMAIENDNDRFFMSEIYIRYEKKIKKYVYGYVKDWDCAEDCVHDVIVKIINNLEHFKCIDEAEQTRLVYLYSKCVAIDSYRRLKKEKSLFDEMPEEPEMIDACVADCENSPEKIVMNEENIRILAKLVDELPDIYREVTVLKYGHHMTSSEIAGSLDVSESVVSTRLMRARQMLLKKGKDFLYD